MNKKEKVLEEFEKIADKLGKFSEKNGILFYFGAMDEEKEIKAGATYISEKYNKTDLYGLMEIVKDEIKKLVAR